MDTSKLKKFASLARTSLIEQVGTRLKTVLAEKSLARRESPKVVEELEKRIKDLGEKRVLEMVAYTWFNRFCALRYMDVNRYTRIGVLSPADGQFQPEILAEAKMGHIDEELVPEATRKQVMRLLDGSDKSTDPQGEAYRLLLVAVCNYYHSLMPFMFEKIADYTELLLPDDLLSGTSIPAYTREALLPLNCSPEHTEESVEVIGWLYQFYISEEKDAVMARKAAVPTDDIPAVTQLFTPHWIVRYLLENSLGRLWMLNHPDSKLRERMPYYIEGETESDFLRVSKPEEIRVLDPACGSGHMLTYAYDLLYAIYDEQGYAPTEIPGLILKHNLFGVEICDRAAALAAFALCMKARASDSRYFRRMVQPNVISLQDVFIADDELEDYVHDLDLGNLFSQPMRKLLRQFAEAKTIGSLIQPCIGEMEIQSTRAQIKNCQSRIENSQGELFLRETHIKVLRVLEQAGALTQRYHVVVANPPYMGAAAMNSKLKDFIESNWKAGKADTYSAFILRNLALAIAGGRVAMITIPNWMFLKTFESLRVSLLESTHISSLIHCGRGVWGSDFGSCAFVIQSARNLEKFGTFKRLFKRQGEVQTNEEIEANFHNLSTFPNYAAANSEFRKIAGSPIAYWVSPAVRSLFSESPSLDDIAPVKHGMSTGCNAKFIRLWHEVEIAGIGFGFASREAAFESNAKWYPYNKGGEFRKWYGNADYVVNYAKGGAAMQSGFIDGSNRGFRHDGKDFYFKPGVSWSFISASAFGVRYSPAGFVFDVAGSSAFPKPDEVKRVTAYLCSRPAFNFMQILNPTVNFQVGNVATLPWNVELLKPFTKQIDLVAIAAIDDAKADWDNFETSWDFLDQPLLRSGLKGTTLEASWRNWDTQCRTAINRMRELETENNRLFIAAYGLDGELQPEVTEDQITLARADVKKDMNALLSYAVGCMMGRYSLDHPGLILANAGDTLREFLKKVDKSLAELTFAPDEDGIVPVLEGEWFDDDIVARTRDFLRATFGEATLAENLQFIEASLGKDLRKYFLNDFYKDHLQTYKKRPIYWLFSSPKGTFNALIYMHRYRPDTVGRVLQYLRDFRDKLAHHEEHLQMTAGSAKASKAEKTKAVKEVANIKKQLKELEEYEKTLFEVAARKIEIDLDNGVKHNYPLFGSVLRKIPGLDAKGDE